MNIILFTRFRGKPNKIEFHSGIHFVGLVLIMLLFMSTAGIAGYIWGSGKVTDSHISTIQTQIQQQRQLISDVRLLARADLDAIAAQVGQLQANVTRINALGQKLVSIAKIDDGEFDFSNAPGIGGPSPEAEALPELNLSEAIGDVFLDLQDKEQQLIVLEQLLLNTQLQNEVLPAGRPIKGGWISSYFGNRTDPFSGKTEFHKGMDFAGKAGTKIYTVAGGVVTWSGVRSGYGLMVEVNHGNGYITRYAHNHHNLVGVGDTVNKGDAIATMGSSGRSTGPHVHLEVLKNGKAINPLKFVKTESS